ncbi:hypothetical protein [Nocardioides cavernaquae]|uniref:Uncharacterized protein n=1 Tax=Nocardioides cavernaquae TaxID=2321396 RepID=A0A3A5HHA9_9ACTN|nr:hypothetical protein [Nocardioides cavernaquae]RJS47454.1 hypothetical protein D4739_15340 [Nocardioides cavernaquae]
MSTAVAAMREDLTAAYRLLREAGEEVHRAATLVDRYSPSIADQTLSTLSLLEDGASRLERAIRQLESR